MTIFTDKELWKRQDTLLGALLVGAGTLVNYVLEHRTFLKPGILSPRGYLGAWPDILLPSLAFFLIVSGVILFGIGVRRYVLPGIGQWRFWPAFVIALLLTIPYFAVYLGTQFIESGDDRLGECPGIVRSVAASGVVTEKSPYPPGGLAIGCGNNQYGMFLSWYNDISIYGVTDPASEKLLLRTLRDYRERTYTHPLHVAFYQRENWSPLRLDASGKAWGGKRGPEDLLKVVTLH